MSCITSIALDELVDVLTVLAADVAGFVASGYSFEGWTGCEWSASCRRRGLTVLPEPRYVDLADGCDGCADLHLKLAAEEVVIELAVLHDWTLPKWLRASRRSSREIALGSSRLQPRASHSFRWPSWPAAASPEVGRRARVDARAVVAAVRGAAPVRRGSHRAVDRGADCRPVRVDRATRRERSAQPARFAQIGL